MTPPLLPLSPSKVQPRVQLTCRDTALGDKEVHGYVVYAVYY